ncbi:MAG: hypothetical protein KDA37_12840, partial [Planctomycetales bacterium]|nr:hypothetical protein [Planctomycetales bacterium]
MNRASLRCFFLLCGLHGGLSAAAQDIGAEAAAETGQVSVEQVQQLLTAAEAATDVDPEIKKQASELCRAALAHLQLAKELAARTEKWGQDAQTAQQRVDEIKHKIEEFDSEPHTIDPRLSLSELEQELAKQEADLATRKKQLATVEAEPQQRAQRRKEVRNSLVAIADRDADVQDRLNNPPADEHPLLARARGLELAARQVVLRQETPALNSELAKYDAEDATDLVRLQRDLRTRRVAASQKRLELLKDRMKDARAAAARESVRKAQDEMISTIPTLKAYAEQNRALAETSQEIAKKLDAAEKDLKAAQDVHEELQRQFNQTRSKEEIVGLTSSIGAMLRKQRTTLPDEAERRRQVRARQPVISHVQFEYMDYDEQRQRLGN